MPLEKKPKWVFATEPCCSGEGEVSIDFGGVATNDLNNCQRIDRGCQCQRESAKEIGVF